MDRHCDYCTYLFPLGLCQCPHCGRPQYFPNVDRANSTRECDALEERYQAALETSKKQMKLAAVAAFEELAKKTQAVMTCRLKDVESILSNDRQVFSTFHQLIYIAFLPEGSQWDNWRETAEVNLFGRNNTPQIRFAALSADGSGLINYKDGECYVHLREDLIAHRTTVFEENNVIFHLKNQGASYPPPGHMASWENRYKLCVAKLHCKIDDKTPTSQFAAIILKNGRTTADDDFVEVHVFGQLTRRTICKIVIGNTNARTKTELMRLRDHAEAANVEVEGFPP